MLLEWTAAGVVVTAATCRHVGTVHSVDGKLREGKQKLAETLTLCLEDGKDFEPKDAEEIGETYRKLKADQKDVEADNSFPKNLFPSTISAARRFARDADTLLFLTTSVSQEARAKRVPFIVIQQPQNVFQIMESLEHADHRSIVTALELEHEEALDDNVEEDLSSLYSEASSPRFGEGNNSIRLRRRGQNWILPGPLPEVHLSPISALPIDFPSTPQHNE